MINMINKNIKKLEMLSNILKKENKVTNKSDYKLDDANGYETDLYNEGFNNGQYKFIEQALEYQQELKKYLLKVIEECDFYIEEDPTNKDLYEGQKRLAYELLGD